MDNATLLERLTTFFSRRKTARELELEAEVEELRTRLSEMEKEKKTADEIYALIEGQLNSGASEVKASEESAASLAIADVVRMANGRA